jgi:uncharacterized membrane protein YfcA
MEYFIIGITAFLASGLTFFSGFGLGTILTPVFVLFFPVPVAIAMTAIVHLSNNLFKLFLVGKAADKKTVIRFGIPAVVAALAGAFLLTFVTSWQPLLSYMFAGRVHEVTLVKLVIGVIIVVFACLELSPRFQRMTIDERYMSWGGALSGFFGGLSGNQGAMRSMFLIKAGLTKEAYIGTNVVLAVIVDLARLPVYGVSFYAVHLHVISGMWLLVCWATSAAFLGAYLGKVFLSKVTLSVVQAVVGAMLIVLGLGLSVGLI